MANPDATGSPAAEPTVENDAAGPEPADDNPEEHLAAIDDNPASLEHDDIKIEYHPSTGRPPVISHFKDFQRHRDRPTNVNPAAFEDEPWKPFQTREDFDFAELCLEAALTQRQVEVLRIIQNAKAGCSELSFQSYKDI